MKLTKVARGVAFGDVSNNAVRNILTEVSKRLFEKIDDKYMEDMRNFFDNKCPYTGEDLSELEKNKNIATDHIVPQNQEYCGLNVPGNLILVDKEANGKKSGLSIEEFMLGDNEYMNKFSYDVRKARYDKIMDFQKKYGYNPEKIKEKVSPLLANIYFEVRAKQIQYIDEIDSVIRSITNINIDYIFIPEVNRKIGDIVRHEFFDILENGQVSKNEVLKLQDLTYSKSIFGLSFPVLSKNKIFTTDGKCRSYSSPIIIFGEEYYVCNDWHNKSMDKLVDYINKFINNINNDCKENKEEKQFNNEYENVNIYVEWDHGYHSFDLIEKHPVHICIKNHECDIVFMDNRKSYNVHKIINLQNYSNLIAVFYKYENILSKDTTQSYIEFPYGGVNSYKYRFNGKENLSNCSKLFESDNELLIERAYEDYHKVIENIVNQ